MAEWELEKWLMLPVILVVFFPVLPAAVVEAVADMRGAQPTSKEDACLLVGDPVKPGTPAWAIFPTTLGDRSIKDPKVKACIRRVNHWSAKDSPTLD